MFEIKFTDSRIEEHRPTKKYSRMLIYGVRSDLKEGERFIKASDIDDAPIHAYAGTKTKVSIDGFRDWPDKDGLYRSVVVFRVFSDKPSQIMNEAGAKSVFGGSEPGAFKPFDKYSPEGRIEAALVRLQQKYHIEAAAKERARIANLIASTLCTRADKAARALGFTDELNAVVERFEIKRRKLFEELVAETRKDPILKNADGTRTPIESRVVEAGIVGAEKLWPSVLPTMFGARGEGEPVGWQEML